MASKNTETKEQKTEKAAENKQEQQWIYCGPNFLKAGLNRFTVFRGKIPDHIQKHFEEGKCPAMRRLFVCPKDLSKVLAAIETNGTPENLWFKQVVQYIQGKGGAE